MDRNKYYYITFTRTDGATTGKIALPWITTDLAAIRLTRLERRRCPGESVSWGRAQQSDPAWLNYSPAAIAYLQEYVKIPSRPLVDFSGHYSPCFNSQYFN
jgi:hypothetical protein